MGAFKNALKKILPPPVNSFMREVNRIVVLEEKNQQKINILTTKMEQQTELIYAQSKALQFQEKQLQVLQSALQEQQLTITKLQNNVMQSQQEQFILLNAISESQSNCNESINMKMQTMENSFREQAECNNKLIVEQKSITKKQYDEQQRTNKDLRSRIDNTNKEITYHYFKGLHPDQYKEALEDWYYQKTGVHMDMNNPKTFNEKIQWLKLYDSTPEKTRLADKYLVREWVAEKIGEEYLIPLLGVYDKFDDIDFDALPNQFVMKANHGSGWNIVVKDKEKFDVKIAKAKFSDWMKKNFAFVAGLELHYKNIIPKIIVEKYMADLDGDIYDYRFFCFNGTPEYVWVDIGSGTHQHFRNIYDMEWNLQDYKVHYPMITPEPEKPATLSKMKELASKLSENFSFVRIDFYSIEKKIYFGEMTFTPHTGLAKWDNEKINLLYGEKIIL